MATVQSTGIGSGLDIESLVEKLVAAERAPTETQITRRESKATLQISALATLKGALSSFKAALEPLKTESGLNPRTVTSSDEDALTATATGDAATGGYDIEVIELAKAHQLASGPFASGATSVVGTGTLTLSQGGKSFDVVIDSSNNTLAKIRDAINDASGNTGVQATLINESEGSRLVLTATATGEDGAIEVSAAGGNGGLAQLAYDPGTLENLDELQPAQDAHIKVATFDVYSPKNTITGAIDGVTLVLTAQTEPGKPVSIGVDHDGGLVEKRVKDFVAAYNSLNATLSQLRTYDPVTQKGGPLLGDAMLRGIEDELRRNLTDPVNGIGATNTTLSSLGITKQLDGSLALDQAKLTETLSTDRTAVAKLFGSQDGVATRMFADIDLRLKSGSALEVRNKSLQADIVRITDDKATLDARMTLIEERYRKQFTALDTLLASLTSTSNYLAQQLENLPTPGKDR